MLGCSTVPERRATDSIPLAGAGGVPEGDSANVAGDGGAGGDPEAGTAVSVGGIGTGGSDGGDQAGSIGEVGGTDDGVAAPLDACPEVRACTEKCILTAPGKVMSGNRCALGNFSCGGKLGYYSSDGAEWTFISATATAVTKEALGHCTDDTNGGCAAYDNCNPNDECIVSDWLYKGRDCDARVYVCGDHYGYEATNGKVWSDDVYASCELSFFCRTWPKGLEPSPDLTVDSCLGGTGP